MKLPNNRVNAMVGTVTAPKQPKRRARPPRALRVALARSEERVRPSYWRPGYGRLGLGFVAVLVVAAIPTLARQRLEPLGLGALMNHSDVVVVGRPVKIALTDGGQTPGGAARMRIVKVLKGEPSAPELDVVWGNGEYELPIASLEYRLLFLRQTGDGAYEEAVSGRSRWLLSLPPQVGKAGEQCFAFALLHNYPASTVSVPRDLVRRTRFMASEVPPKINPIEVEALCVDDLRKVAK